MDKITQYLEQLDLSEIEAKLYITLLKNGSLSVQNLSQITGIKRTTIYLYVDQLTEKGLITKVVQGAKKQVAPTPVESLSALVKKKVEQAKHLETELSSVMEIIQKTLPQTQDITNSEIKYYKGELGVRKIYEEAVKAKEFYSYANLAQMHEVFPDNVELFVNIFKKNKDLILHEIVEDSPLSREEIKLFSQSDRYHFKFLPSNITITSSDILIFDNKVGIINTRGNITGMIIHNVDYFNFSKELFNFIWSILPEAKI